VLQSAANERAAADTPPSDDDEPDATKDHDDGKPHPALDSNIQQAMFMHEAATILNLHAQAVAVQNIRSLIPVVLDLATSNYGRWSDQFLLVVGKFALEHHVLHDPPACIFLDWTCMDCVVKSWIYGIVSSNLADTAMEHNTTARAAWLVLRLSFSATGRRGSSTSTCNSDSSCRAICPSPITAGSSRRWRPGSAILARSFRIARLSSMCSAA